MLKSLEGLQEQNLTANEHEVMLNKCSEYLCIAIFTVDLILLNYFCG